MANNAKNELSIGDKKNKKNRKSMRKKKDKERKNKKDKGDKEDENDDWVFVNSRQISAVEGGESHKKFLKGFWRNSTHI